ncbi:beta-lactamase [Intrasporangium oryzae NRRL B-24470]|uniref:Beta-lactamase n=1 Tax=Intrasporangium oryzae NRRL B-24470 TaxID=1386089 RepID=W9GE29_9MICO|nr:serine hydrolase [Intrasporangium oryzae]EWT03472.1 beta-lactamase [Intrasporangium oryzae NRRL B-24470]
MISPSFDDLDARLDAVTRNGGTVSVWLGDLDGRARWTRDAGVPHYAASTMKLPLVVAFERRVVRGELDPDTPVEVRNLFHSAADSSPFTMDEADDQDPETWAAVGGTRTLRQLAEHALTHSGNLATNLLLDAVGRDEVAVVLAAADCSPATVVARGIEDVAAREAGLTNTVTAADLGVLLSAVARRDERLGGEAVCGPVEEILSRQVWRDQIPAGLPEGTWTANKTGWVTGVSHDACLVRPADRDPFVLVVCTTIDLGEEDAARLVASVARDVWATVALSGEPAGPAVASPAERSA